MKQTCNLLKRRPNRSVEPRTLHHPPHTLSHTHTHSPAAAASRAPPAAPPAAAPPLPYHHHHRRRVRLRLLQLALALLPWLSWLAACLRCGCGWLLVWVGMSVVCRRRRVVGGESWYKRRSATVGVRLLHLPSGGSIHASTGQAVHLSH